MEPSNPNQPEPYRSYPSFGIVLLVITPFYVNATNYFRRVVREVKRLEGISRAPIFSHFSETISGLSTLRAFSHGGGSGSSSGSGDGGRVRPLKRWRAMAADKLDANARTYVALKAVDRWLAVRLEFMGNGEAQAQPQAQPQGVHNSHPLNGHRPSCTNTPPTPHQQPLSYSRRFWRFVPCSDPFCRPTHTSGRLAWRSNSLSPPPRSGC